MPCLPFWFVGRHLATFALHSVGPPGPLLPLEAYTRPYQEGSPDSRLGPLPTTSASWFPVQQALGPFGAEDPVDGRPRLRSGTRHPLLLPQLGVRIHLTGPCGSSCGTRFLLQEVGLRSRVCRRCRPRGCDDVPCSDRHTRLAPILQDQTALTRLPGILHASDGGAGVGHDL